MIKEIRNKVAMYCSSLDAVTPLRMSSMVIAELLPFKGLSSDPDAGKFQELVAIVKAIKIKATKHHYSKNGLIDFIETEFLAGKTIADLHDIIGDIHICRFPESEELPMSFSFKSQNVPRLRADYGDEEYVPKEKNISERKSPTAEQRPKSVPVATSPAPTRSSINASANIALTRLRTYYVSIRKSDLRYFWQWRLSKEEYIKLKSLLADIDFTTYPREMTRACAPQIALFIAEWYKREYDGNSSSDWMNEIGLPNVPSQLIWEYSGIDNSLLFYKEDTNMHEWLYSIYVLGGFPIKYTMRAGKFDFMFDEIWGEDRDMNTISDEQISEITSKFDSNQTLRFSLTSGSLHDYYRYLRIQENMPIAESDKNDDPFKPFIKKLLEGKDNFFNNYIRAEWVLYIDPESNVADSDIRISFGRKKDKCYIPAECLSHWNIPLSGDVPEFWIEVVAELPKHNKETAKEATSDSENNTQRTRIRFSKTGPGSHPYVGWTRENTIELTAPYCEETEVHVNLVIGDKSYSICKPFRPEGCAQFYKTRNPYEWSSRTDNGVRTAVLYNPVLFRSGTKETVSRTIQFGEDGNEFEWMPLTDKIILTDSDGKEVTFIPRNSILSLSFKPLTDTIRYSNFRNIHFIQKIDGEEQDTELPLLREKEFSINFTPFGSDKPEKIPLSKCEIRFKQRGDSGYSIWNAKTFPKQGVTSLLVTYPDKHVSVTSVVYYLPAKVPVLRNVETREIVFDQSLKDVQYPLSASGGHAPVSRNDEGKYVFKDDLKIGYEPSSDTIPFILGNDGDEYAKLEVYRSSRCKELYLKGDSKPLKRYGEENSLIRIPYILRHNFRVRAIDKTGVKNTTCGENVWMDFSNNSPVKDAANGFNYYMFNPTGHHERDIIQLETGQEQYKFFYWDMNPRTDAVPVSFSFDKDTKTIHLDTSLLKENESGFIFQSVRGLSPRHYFSPIKGEKFNPPHYSNRIKCFEIAAFHSIPFRTFICLQKAVSFNDSLMNFIQQFMESKDWNPSLNDCKNLHRFANEFLFEWILLPKGKFWRKITNNHPKRIDAVNRLFRSSPFIKEKERDYVERILHIYWESPSSSLIFRRTNSIHNIVLQCIRGESKDFSLIGSNIDHDESIKFLHSIYEDREFLENIYRIMTEIKNNRIS